MRVLVTGASGFVGRALVPRLIAEGYEVRAAARASPLPPVEVVRVPDLAEPIDWAPILAGVDAVVHLAGIAHTRGIPDAQYDAVNTRATEALARAARQTGVSRFVFMSSVRAQCGRSADHVLTETDPPQPTEAYGRSKLAAEAAVAASGVPYTILRPVLIYGPQAKGNLATLARLAALPLPLPFAAFDNRRSLVSLENVIRAILFVLRKPATVGETYLVAEPEPLTLAEMIAALRRGPPRLFPVPPGLLRALARLVGRGDLWDRIGGDLVANPAKLMAAGWAPAPSSLRDLAAGAEFLDLAQ